MCFGGWGWGGGWAGGGAFCSKNSYYVNSLLPCCADLSTGHPLIIQRKYLNAPESESELFTGDILLSTVL